MTVDIPDIDDILRKLGYRATSQRRTIYNALMKKRAQHPTVAEIYESAEKEDPTISLATVYKALQLFTDIGLVNEMGFRDESTRYDPGRKPHVNVICTKCGSVEDYEGIDLGYIAPLIESSTNFEVIRHRYEVYGLCVKCQQEHDR